MEQTGSKAPVALYFLGLTMAIIALLVSNNHLVLKNILFSVAIIAAGYHVVIIEGIGETIENSKLKKRFTPNSHLLMGLAAMGAFIIGNFWEGTLLILIFSGAQFLEHFAEGRSKREITKLLKMTPTTARLIGAGGKHPNSGSERLKDGRSASGVEW